MPSACGADTLANELIVSLTAGTDFTLPVGSEPVKLTNEILTTGIVGGEGTFDVIMTSMRAHLLDEYEKNRITGDQYVKAYIELTTAALSGAVQYLLGRDGSFWQAILLRMQSANAQAEFAFTKMKLSSEDANYCNLKVQKDLLLEQVETARSGTLDTRTDGTPVTGSVGKQKDLYSQQITSYIRDAETKAAKLWTDAWITMKTLDEGLNPPNQYTNSEVDEVLSKIKTNNALGTG